MWERMQKKQMGRGTTMLSQTHRDNLENASQVRKAGFWIKDTVQQWGGAAAALCILLARRVDAEAAGCCRTGGLVGDKR